jgi:hypothetical protein
LDEEDGKQVWRGSQAVTSINEASLLAAAKSEEIPVLDTLYT